jgi:hypothetical protein
MRQPEKTKNGEEKKSSGCKSKSSWLIFYKHSGSNGAAETKGTVYLGVSK